MNATSRRKLAALCVNGVAPDRIQTVSEVAGDECLRRTGRRAWNVLELLDDGLEWMKHDQYWRLRKLRELGLRVGGDERR